MLLEKRETLYGDKKVNLLDRSKLLFVPNNSIKMHEAKTDRKEKEIVQQ